MKLLKTALALAAFATVAVGYESPEDCEWNPVDEGDAVGLTCHLSAINSNSERTNFSVIPARGTVRLDVRCRSADEVSTLEPNAFSSLSDLESLAITGCRLEHVPSGAFAGLDRLRSLSINSEHSSFLAIEAGGLSGLPNLEDLNLGGNYLRSLPGGELCNLPRLRTLNVSGNEIASLSQLGLGECMERLQVLDLSHNEISELKGSEVRSDSLLELVLSSNYIGEVHEAALAGLAGLELLDLSDNQLTSLPERLFRGNGDLLVLSLANNSLAKLDSSAFDQSLQKLEVLDLSGNELTAESLHFARLRSLTEIGLSRNRVAGRVAADKAFPRSLEALRLDNNMAGELKGLDQLTNLKELDASGNRMAAVPETLPASITHLHLSGNRIQEVIANSLSNASGVLVLDLSDNQLTAVPAALGGLQVLQTLDLSGNLVGSLEGASILGLRQLWRLQLRGNRIRQVRRGLFDELRSLQILDLSSNGLGDLERGSFDACEQLRAVRLDANDLESVDGLFTDLERLLWLNVSQNSIRAFDYAMVPRSLQWLDVSHNRISELGDYYDLAGELSLTTVEAGFNRIRILGPNSVPDGVETLGLNDNAIEQIVPYTFFKKTRLAKVDLTVNNLKTIDRNALRLSASAGGQQSPPSFHLGGNPIECNCDMVWFKSVNDPDESAGNSNSVHSNNYPRVVDIESIYCRLVNDLNSPAFVPLVEARNEQFLCPYETHCFALCKCCDFDACDCEMSCPDNCTCYHDASWSKNVAVCSAADFQDLPEQLPMDATEIFLDGNSLTELGSHTFIGRKNLRILHLNNSHIATIQNKTFNGLRSLAVLHLEGNELSSLEGYEFETLSNLRELYLQDNLLRSVHNATFKFLRSLEVLHLHNNRLIDFPVWQLALNPFLVSVKLAENLWSCDCEYMERFRSWMSVYSSKIFDSEAVSCVSNEATEASADSNLRISDFDVGSCNSNSLSSSMNGAIATTRVQELVGEGYLPMLAATLASFAVVLLVLLLAFVYRHTLRVYIHSKYGVRVFDTSFDDDDELVVSENGSLDSVATTGGGSPKLFDVFVSYSPKDDLFAREVLASELEQGSSHRYKTCLFHRDVGGQTYLADVLVQATEASRRSIIVLSENFLKSEWSRYDYKSGLHQAMKCNRSKKSRMIIVILGDVSSRDLDPDLRLYLKTCGVVLRYGDRMFWQRLRYALPDVPMSKLSRNNNGLNNHVVQHTYAVQQQQQQRVEQQLPEDHYYQTPRYAGYTLPPPQQPVSPQHHHSVGQNQVYQQHLQQQQHHHYQQLSISSSASSAASRPASRLVAMPPVPGAQVMRTSPPLNSPPPVPNAGNVVMHI